MFSSLEALIFLVFMLVCGGVSTRREVSFSNFSAMFFGLGALNTRRTLFSYRFIRFCSRLPIFLRVRHFCLWNLFYMGYKQNYYRKMTMNGSYYSFKIFPRFWLAKSTCKIHHNQLLMTKFGKILCLTRKWRQKCSLLRDAPFNNWEELRTRLSCFRCKN